MIGNTKFVCSYTVWSDSHSIKINLLHFYENLFHLIDKVNYYRDQNRAIPPNRSNYRNPIEIQCMCEHVRTRGHISANVIGNKL